MTRDPVLLGAAFLATFLVTSAGPGAPAPGTPTSDDSSAAAEPPYIQRGDQVEARYRAYRERLERDRDTLAPLVRAEAPDLYPGIVAANPAPVPYGYGILPKVIADPPPSAAATRPIASSYSWPRTDASIDAALRKLTALEARLDGISAQPPDARRAEWERVVEDYVALARGHRLINTNIQYNRLWQGEIARDRAAYDELTVLHDAVLERQAILDALQAGQAVGAREKERAEALLRVIRRRTDVLVVPAFVRVEHRDERRWIVRVPVQTDIEDDLFLQTFREAVEHAWHVQADGDEFRVALDFRHVPASRLYAGGHVPGYGEHIDLSKHIARFPLDAAVLTTGANTTHVLGRSIVLGPHDIAPNVLAHEFGHLLGFVDGYFRGYRDRGPDGYEVLEVVIDPSDIMSAPGIGHVSRRHFERVIGQRRASGLRPVRDLSAR